MLVSDVAIQIKNQIQTNEMEMMQLDRDEGAHLARAWTDGHNVDLLFS